MRSFEIPAMRRLRNRKGALKQLTIRGTMAGCRLTQAGPPRTTVIVSLDGLSAEFAEGERVRVTMERISGHTRS
jgi:hypothetical protein